MASKMRGNWGALIAAAVVLAIAAPGRADAQARQPVAVKIGYLPFIDSLPVFIAQEKKFLSEEGFQAELHQFRFGGLAMEALLTKRIDIGVSAFIQPSQIAAETGVYSRLLHPLLWEGEHKGKVLASNALMVRKESSIRKLSDFKGKTIAVGGFGTLQYFALQALFKKAGMDPRRDIKFLELPYPTQPGALDAGKIDGAAMVEPFLGYTEEKGLARAIVDPPVLKYRSYYLIFGREFPVSGLWAHPDLVREFPDTGKRMARALARSIEWMYSNQDEAYDIGTKWLKLERKFIKRMVEDGGYWKPYPRGWTERDWQSLRAQVKLFEEYGAVKKPVDIKRLVELP
ncbi:MAG: ABC transporter substrate-binding protein [Elusimicrobia bacterium]|nr:ABC transporter substrate-binding protein [Elusimicrobiota bacterium]